MRDDNVRYKLRNKESVTRTIKVEKESDGSDYLLEVIDTCLTAPKLSWTLFGTRPEAEAGAEAQYQVSLKEGFTPLDLSR